MGPETVYLLYRFTNRNIPLLRTLTILMNEFPKEQGLAQVKDDIVQGISLSHSLKNRGIGDEFVFVTIHIGEETGNIPDGECIQILSKSRNDEGRIVKDIHLSNDSIV